MSEAVDVSAVEHQLGYRFTDRALLVEALTHPSFAHEHPGTPHFQRLEFLGDAVLGLCVAERLFEQHAGAPESELTWRRHEIVAEAPLARHARGFGLAAHLRVGNGVRADQDRLLADGLEAIIGALYLDGGLDAAAAFLDRMVPVTTDAPARNPVTILQERCQAAWKRLPDYTYLERADADGEQAFEVAVTLPDGTCATGFGRSKPAARRAAAAAALAGAAPEPPAR